MTDTTVPPKPRLGKGESPSDPAFQKRMREWQRAVALAEATEAQKSQNKAEAEKRAERDVLAEVDKGIKEADDSVKRKTPVKPKPKATSDTDKSKRRKSLDEKIEAAEGR